MTHPMRPTILFVPGFWEGSAPFAKVISILQSQDYPTDIALLPSTGTTSPGNPSMSDDIAAIHTKIAEIVNKDQHVLLVAHSAGGFLGSTAIQDLDTKTRQDRGLSGGVAMIVFIAAGILPAGVEHKAPAIFKVDGGALTCPSPESILFNDLEPADAQPWIEKLQTQPAAGWDGVVSYCGWQHVPSVYLVCENDRCLPWPVQIQMAEIAGSKFEKCKAGHMPMISDPVRVAEVIVQAVREMENATVLGTAP